MVVANATGASLRVLLEMALYLLSIAQTTNASSLTESGLLEKVERSQRMNVGASCVTGRQGGDFLDGVRLTQPMILTYNPGSVIHAEGAICEA